MDNQAFTILEFDSLRSLVRRYAQTDMGRARIDAIAPIDDRGELRLALAAIGEGVQLRAQGVRWSFEGVADPNESISRLRIEGAALDALALLDLARLCDRAMDARGSILTERDKCPTMFAIVAGLPRELNKLNTLIGKKIL